MHRHQIGFQYLVAFLKTNAYQGLKYRCPHPLRPIRRRPLEPWRVLQFPALKSRTWWRLRFLSCPDHPVPRCIGPEQRPAVWYEAVIRLQHLGSWVALRTVGRILICSGMSVQDLSSPLFTSRIGVLECEISHGKELSDSNILEWRSEQNHVMLLEIIGSDVAAGFDGGLHTHLPKKARQHCDTLELASTGVSILVVEWACLGNK